MSNSIKVAIVGCGRVSYTAHYDSIKEYPETYDFRAVCDVNKNRADKWAKENSVKPYYSIEELLKSEDLDLVTIATPNGTHAKLGILAAKAGVNVMVEKPLAMNVDDADKLMDACIENNVNLFVIMQNRYNETNKILKSCIDKGRFGKITTANVTLSWCRSMKYFDEGDGWRKRRDLAGGVFTNQAVHYLDIIQWLVGAPPESVYAKMGTIYSIDVEDHGAGIIKFKNGVIGTVVLTNHAYPDDHEGSITIIGESGMVKIGGKSMNKVEKWDFKDSDIEDELIKKAESSPPTVYGFGHYEMYERVGNFLMTGVQDENLIDGYEGRRAVALMDALYMSDKLCKEVRFPIGKR